MPDSLMKEKNWHLQMLGYQLIKTANIQSYSEYVS